MTGRGVKHNQTGFSEAGQTAQGGVKFSQTLPDELNAPVSTCQGIEYVAVEDKHAMNVQTALEGVVQRSVVIHTQIAAEPHQAAVKGFVFVHR